MTPPRGLHPPTHVIPAQAARILGLSRQTMRWHTRPGGRLEPETWYGTRMIPIWKVIRFQDQQKPGLGSDPAPGAPTFNPTPTRPSR